MTRQENAAREENPTTPRDDQHTPLLAMWYQTRAALADLSIPVFAGWKVVWLITFAPLSFFDAYLNGTQRPSQLRSPFDVLWRALSPKERKPLDAAKFLLFGILTAALAGFGFDNSNRVTGMLTQLGLQDDILQSFPGLADVSLSLRNLATNETMQAIQAFFDRDLISAIIELIATLFVTMLFAYLFRLVVGRKLSATASYSFWLYMTGMQFFTTGITFFFFKLFSLPAINLPRLTPEIFYLALEYGWLLLWLYVLPLLILPRLYPTLTVRRTLLALLVTHAVFVIAGWLLRAGFTSVVLLWSTFVS